MLSNAIPTVKRNIIRSVDQTFELSGKKKIFRKSNGGTAWRGFMPPHGGVANEFIVAGNFIQDIMNTTAPLGMWSSAFIPHH
jgi:hypothetical protein